MKNIKFFLILILLMAFSDVGFSLIAKADGLDSKNKEKQKDDNFIELTISAAPEPVPALQYRLLPSITVLKTGNAALDWSKLTTVVPADLDEYHNLKEGDLDHRDLVKLPFDEFKNEQLEYANKFYKVSSNSFLKYAALKNNCDWQDAIEDGINMQLPSLNSLRKIAYLVALEARVNVAKGDYNSALELLSYNFALAQDLSEGITLIQNLVGIGVASMNYRVIDDIVAQPDSPNLYWALTMMPSPLIDMRNAFESEMDAWVQPYVGGLETNILSVEQANSRFNELLQAVDSDYALAVLIAAGYVPGKKYLVENGLDPDWVEMMPASQVVLLAQWKQYLPLRDNMFKYLFTPYSQGRVYLEEQRKRFVNNKSFMTNIFYQLLPALGKCKFQTARLQVKADAFQCVEAIRMYVAANGNLPETLSDITLVPIPLNAFTNKEFKYYLDGDCAILDVQDPEDDKYFAGYRIKLNK